jgi:hypothetical protein
MWVRAVQIRGLCDMHACVGEWVADRYGPYAAGPSIDPAGPGPGTNGSSAVVATPALDGRSAMRFHYDESDYPPNRSFRVATDP